MDYFNKKVFIDFCSVYMNRTVVDQQGILKKGAEDIKQLADMMHKYNLIVSKIDAAKSGSFVWSKNPYETVDAGLEELNEIRENKAKILRKKILFLNQKSRDLIGRNFVVNYIDPNEKAIPVADEFCKCIFVPGAAI